MSFKLNAFFFCLSDYIVYQCMLNGSHFKSYPGTQIRDKNVSSAIRQRGLHPVAAGYFFLPTQNKQGQE